MPPMKRGLGKSVLEAARERICWTFDTFSRIYVSFSGGKDSTVMLHLVMEEAARRRRRVGLFFVDWEAQFKLTVDHVARCFDLYRDLIDPYWVAVPLVTTNACSQVEPEWTCWERGKENLWVREKPSRALTESAFPFYTYATTFEEFVPAFGHWYAGGELTACFVGIRAAESLNRWRTIAGHGTKFEGRMWTNWIGQTLYNVYPIYDWQAEDVWTYQARTGLPYNPLYDRMHQAGLSIHQMRICEPYGDEQRKGLWLYQVIEPETWAKVCARVAGANTGALYGGESGNVMGNIKIALPGGHTWKSFAEFLLASMPPATADHYRDKIAVWLNWYRNNQGLYEIPDERPGDTGPKDMASWRRVCKTLLKNDYWCKTLCFNPTKATAYEKYKKIMRKRRQAWGIYE
jgi:predicted phosphoadenosine phosphosulfate sulfurtransferase